MIIPGINWLSAAAGALVAGAIAYQVGSWRGASAGYDKHVAEIAAASLKAELERKGDDAKLQGLSDFDLCVLGLRGNGMPVDACDQLRGLQQE
ncbi:hypothetical protein EDC40_103631 [Aminobacter aminovorans]|uniref:Uncharacterized protein n=1 Tax=Aminobacter aminovorans TaxID=83263 RepID=A0A380WL10_AMIAI|nr:hypothetical protein [Aminobacter aminovorans]TCS28163.1 hypothetical protein EDC40_103631 [Aminobacter aminovorans]SUU89425.1 Uncharacterised protein [Aminobacter aminovorans]